MPNENILIEADFNPSVRTYWLLTGIIFCIATIVGILALPFWIILGNYFTGKYLDRMRCALTPRALIVEKGLFVRMEKTVPLDKITDIAMVQGPIMRAMNLHKLSVETAGQSSASGASLISLTGIVDARAFRDAVLKQRDAITEQSTAPAHLPATDPATISETNEANQAINEIRDTLNRIERVLDEK